MRLPVLQRKLWRGLWASRGQAAAIALVIAAGVALLVLMHSTLDSLELTRATYYQSQRFADVFAPLQRAPRQVADAIAAIPGVAAVETRVVADVSLDLPELSEPATGRLISIPTPRRPILCDLFLLRGRWILPGRRDEVVLSESFAEVHGLGPGDYLEAVIHGRRRQLDIVGVALSPEYIYSVRPGELMPDDTRFAILWMDRQALAAAFDLTGSFNDVVLRLAPGTGVDPVIDRLDRILEPWGGLGAIPRSLQTSNWYLEAEMEQLRGFGSALPVIFLAVAAFLLHVVLSRSVALEREQIAVLKAVGYGNGAVAFHYVQQALVIAAAGSLLGVGAGAWLGGAMTRLYAEFYRFPVLEYRLALGVAVVAVAVSLTAAVLGAAGAVRRVVTLPPAEAMRPEPPSVFRPGLLERGGLTRWLEEPSRIILRNLSRRWGRALLSVTGIAFGGALMIVGSLSIDAIDEVLRYQFDVAQHWDVLVTFSEPASAGALAEMQRYPGVRAAEPFRSVPVRLRAGTRSRPGSLQGIPEGARLHRLVDDEGRVRAVPPAGLMLSRVLAEVLAVDTGDEVLVEVLTGDRRRFRLPVAALLDDFMGTNAYIDAGQLHRLLREGRTVSGVYLAADAARLDDLYRRLKTTPRVAGVLLERATIESFEETLGDNIALIRTINILFAAIITFGVVYNNARISLSERSRELATLRVIGFTRGEISYILLGEVGTLAVVGAVAGLGVGWALAALTAQALDTEVYRIPLVISPRTLASSVLAVLASASLSAVVVHRKLRRLDLVAVLKTRE